MLAPQLLFGIIAQTHTLPGTLIGVEHIEP